MLDRKACKKMWVWDGNRSNPKDRQRIVIDIFSDGGCRVVADDYENTFYESDDYYDTRLHDHCEEITESKPRAFKGGEMPVEWRDYWYREKNCTDMYRPTGYNGYLQEAQLCFHGVWSNNEYLYENYEVQKTINGEWGIVGVNE